MITAALCTPCCGISAIAADSAISAAVTGCCCPVVNVTPYRNSFQICVNCQITVTIRIGGDSGITMRQNVRKNPAPSIRAARINSGGIEI